jgi:hypothetical protein
MKKEAKLINPRDWQLIRNFLIGGSALGAGVGLGTALYNYLHTLKSEAQEDEDTSRDDDILNIYLPEEEKQASLPGGLAMAGGVASSLLAYALVRKLYQDFKKSRAQAQLDDAQEAYISEISKTASEKEAKFMSYGELLTSAPVAAALLLAGAGGIVANRALAKAFPNPKKHVSDRPRRVVIKKAPKKVDDNEETSQEKRDDDLQEGKLKNASEYLIRFVMSDEKRANESGLKDLVCAVAQGRGDELRGQSYLGMDTLMDMTKGASEGYSDPYREELAKTWLVNDAVLGPSVRLTVAAEYHDMSPAFSKLAAGMEDGHRDLLFDVGAEVGEWSRYNAFEPYQDKIPNPDIDVKEAGFMMGMGVDNLLEMISGSEDSSENTRLQESIDERTSTESEEYMDVGDVQNGEENVTKVVGGDQAGEEVIAEHKDIIDEILDQGESQEEQQDKARGPVTKIQRAGS